MKNNIILIAIIILAIWTWFSFKEIRKDINDINVKIYHNKSKILVIESRLK